MKMMPQRLQTHWVMSPAAYTVLTCYPCHKPLPGSSG